MTIHCRVIACFFVSWYVTLPFYLDFWPFNLEQLTYMAGHVANPSTKFEDTTPIRSWVMSYNGSSWLPLRMRSRPLRMRRITLVGGQKQLHIWNPRLRFAYSLYNFHWAPTTIKSRLLSSRLMLKPGVHTIHIGFATAKRHFLARNRVVWSILRQNRCGSFPQAPPPQKKIAESLCAEGREITHAQNRNPYTDLEKILHGGRYPLHKFRWPSVKGFFWAGVKFHFSHWLASSPLQHCLQLSEVVPVLTPSFVISRRIISTVHLVHFWKSRMAERKQQPTTEGETEVLVYRMNCTSCSQIQTQ